MSEKIDYIIRPLTQSDEQLLWEMCYQALNIPRAGKALKEDTVNQPRFVRYVRQWGRVDDRGFVSTERGNERPIGAAWFRLLTGDDKGFGYIDDATPELSIIVLPKYQGRGIGTKLMTVLLEEAIKHYPAISLSVLSNNPVLRLYQRLGFIGVYKTDDILTMKKILNKGYYR